MKLNAAWQAKHPMPLHAAREVAPGPCEALRPPADTNEVAAADEGAGSAFILTIVTVRQTLAPELDQ